MLLEENKTQYISQNYSSKNPAKKDFETIIGTYISYKSWFGYSVLHTS